LGGEDVGGVETVPVKMGSGRSGGGWVCGGWVEMATWMGWDIGGWIRMMGCEVVEAVLNHKMAGLRYLDGGGGKAVVGARSGVSVVRVCDESVHMRKTKINRDKVAYYARLSMITH
jgi:hypothetical protein